MRSREVEDAARSVGTRVTYLTDGSCINRRFVGPGFEINTGEYAPYDVTVRDARPLRDHFSLDSHGFVLLNHQSAVKDFFDKEQVDALYPDEAAATIQAHTGADLVTPMGWMIRTSGDLSRFQHKTSNYEHQGGVQPPAGEAHVDFSPDRIDQMVYERYTKQFPDGKPYRRFLVTSFWRTFSPAPQDCPLALCDGNTVGDTEGTPNTLHVVDRPPSREEMLRPLDNEDKMVAAAIFRFNPNWRWWYFSNMHRDEASLFKLHDSTRKQPWRVPHTAFFDNSFPNARPRASIELRSVAYFF